VLKNRHFRQAPKRYAACFDDSQSQPSSNRMNRLLTKKIERRIQAAKDKRLGNLFIFIGLIAFISSIYSGRQYNLTIIKFEYVVAVHIASGLVFGILTLKYKEKLEGKDFNIFRHFIWTMLVYGAIFCALFYLTNRQFSDKNEYELSFQIIERHRTYRTLTNYTVISIQDFTKDIKFPNNEMTELNNANFVTLTLSNGLWGVPIIKNSKLTKQ
jgi:hypothetical protein